MLRLLALSLFAGAVLALPTFAQAQAVHLYADETMDAKLDFLRNLRKKGYSALAKDFAEILLKTATPEQAPILNLELARTAVALAKEQPLGQRTENLDKARASFEPFIKANPNSPAGAQARLEMARLYAIQGSMALNKALVSEIEEERDKGADKARALYDAADGEFDAAIKVLTTLKLDNDVVQAEFDRANNLLEKASTFINTERAGDNRKRATTVDEARKIFAPIAKDISTANGLLANAYLVKCYQDGQDPSKVNEHYGIVLNATGPHALPAKQMGTYYKILYIRSEPNFVGDKTKATQEQIGVWLANFPTAKRSYQGEHLRFELALIHIQYAGLATKGFKAEEYAKLNPKDKALVLTNFNAADKIAQELERDNGDFSERGQGLHVAIVKAKIELGITEKGTPGSGGEFDNALLVAKLKFQEAAKATDKEVAAKLFVQGQVLLRKAIAIGEKDGAPVSKMHEAQFLLGSAFYGLNDRRRAAILFETLARATPPSKKGAEAAGFAIELYRKYADDERDETARYYLRELGDFILTPSVQKQWSGDTVFGVTRYNLAMDYLAEKNFKVATDHLAKLPKDFPAFVYAQGQGAFISLQAREAEETPEGKKLWTKSARDFIERMGPLPAAADATTTLMWFTSSVERPKFLYAEASELLRDGKEKEAAAVYAEMAKSIGAIEAAFKKDGGKLAEEKKKAVEFTIEVLTKYSHLGAADIEYRKGNFARILEDEMLGSLVRQIFEIDQKKGGKGEINVVDVRVVGESLSLVLRAFVQLGQLDQAKGVYGMLMRIKPVAGGEAQDNANFTRSLIQDLAAQAEGLKEKGDTAKLKEMVGKFTLFGDALAKTLVYDKKNPELRDIKNLTRFYLSLDQFKKAADLIKTIPEPKYLSQKGLKANEEQEKELYIYWDFQIEHGRLLRLSKDWEGSNKILGRVTGHENARLQTLAKKEQIHIYEDRESYGVATKLWKEYMGDLQRAGIGQNKRMQELYFEGYYFNTLCFYKLSQKEDVKKSGKSDAYLKLAAQLIVRLQTSKDNLGWQIVGPRFQEYMNRERTLKTAYDVALKAAK